ncbi:MAG: BatD family protein [Candidatus Zixiibacteriota bacterium]
MDTPARIGEVELNGVFQIFGLFIVILGLSLCPLASFAKSAEVTIEAVLDRDTIGLDEQAILQVIISSTDQNTAAPNIPTLPMFEVYSQGRSSNISIVNGAVSASMTYRYILMPQKAGNFPVEQIAVVHENKRYVADPITLTILDRGVATSPELEEQAGDAGGGSRDYFLEANIDNSKPYVGQQVTFTLKFFIAVQSFGSPELTEPVMTGFWSEVLGNKPVYFQNISNRRYKVIERKYALFPTQTGELTIGRSIIRTTIATAGKGYRDPFDVFGNVFGRGTEITVRSQPVVLNVRPLPEKGKPKDFTGTVGKFSITATIDKREVEVSQPLTAVFKITGVGNVKSVAEPTIPDLQDFRVYRSSSSENMTKLNDLLGGTKIFEEVFIPNRPGEQEIPAISYNYFDPEAGKYRTINTQAFKIKVRKPEGYAAAPDLPFQSSELAVGSEARDIRYIKSEIGKVQDKGQVLLFTPFYIFVNGLPVAILAGLVLVRKRRERLQADIGYARSRTASKAARRRLAKARSLAKPQTLAEFYAELNLALTAYVADKLNISPHGLTTDKVETLLIEKNANEKLVSDFIAIINQCDFARFAPASLSETDMQLSLAKAEQIMAGIEGVQFEQ